MPTCEEELEFCRQTVANLEKENAKLKVEIQVKSDWLASLEKIAVKLAGNTA